MTWTESNIVQWVDDNQAQWLPYSVEVLNQIWTDEDYVYAAINIGFDIIDITTESKIGYIEYDTGFSTVWANNDKVFLGTTNGINYINKTCISGVPLVQEDLLECLIGYSNPYGITSDDIRYIHGSGDTLLMCCTSLGADVYWGNYGYRSSTTISGAQKCFMTSTGKFYYTVDKGTEWELNRVDSEKWNWTTPDYSYVTGSGILEAGVSINDIFVTENTASNTIDNTIFVATSSGVCVIDEGGLDNEIYYTANNFTAIWADADTSISGGQMYVASPSALSVINTASKTLVDIYSATVKGAANEYLQQEDVVDINIQ
jgi:hypothetical protein